MDPSLSLSLSLSLFCYIYRNNPLGRKGEVVEEFAVVIKALWSGQYRSISPRDLRDTVCKYVPEFSKHIGHHHDSQEFLLFLMDGLHEDVNQVRWQFLVSPTHSSSYNILQTCSTPSPSNKTAVLSTQGHPSRNIDKK